MSKFSEFLDKNPIKSLLAYTIIVTGTLGAAYKFTIADAKLERKQAEIDAQKSTIDMYIHKVTALEHENESLIKQNEKYMEWIIQDHNSIPFYENKIQELEAALKGQDNQKNKASDNSTHSSRLYQDVRSIKKSESHIDNVSQLIFGVIDIDSNDSASIRVVYPDGKEEIKKIEVGYTEIYQNGDKKYRFHVASISWIYNSCLLEIYEMKDSNFPEK